MPRRKTVLANNEVYHVLNRGVASSTIFRSSINYKRFISLINYYLYVNLPLSYSQYLSLSSEAREEFRKNIDKSSKFVDVYAFCLMDNHFHLLLKQVSEDGIKNYISRVQNAYSKYFNLKYKRSGPLFQSRFKAKWISSDEILLHISRYIHLNPCTAYLTSVKGLAYYKWSSYPEYISERTRGFVDTSVVVRLIGNRKKYKDFVQNQANYQRSLKRIRDSLLE